MHQSVVRTIVLGLAIWVASLILFSLPAAAANNCAVPAQYSSVQDALADPDCARIELAAGTYRELLAIERAVIIAGEEATNTILDGEMLGRVVQITPSGSARPQVVLRNVTVRNGRADRGAGINNNGAALTLENCIISNNEAGMGGGIYNSEGGPAALVEVAVEDNIAGVDGGGIFNFGNMTISNSGINRNEASGFSGGGIRNEGTLVITNSTISNNRDNQVHGSGISTWDGKTLLYNSTVSHNEGSAGLYNYNGLVRIHNSLLAQNSSGDCAGTIKSGGHNLVASGQGCNLERKAGDVIGANPRLANLSGQPGYHDLLFGPGVNGGDPDGCRDRAGELLPNDQRGQPRNGRCDTGAIEYQGGAQDVFLAFCAAGYAQPCFDFSDDFSDPNSGWYTGEDEISRFAYVNGEYEILGKDASYFYVSAAPTCLRQNYDVAVDARWHGDTGNSYGLMFGLHPDSPEFYLFEMNTDYQMFLLAHRGSDGWTMLLEPQMHEAIAAKGATNRLQVRREGQRIVLAVNGTVLAEVDDNRINGPTGAALMMSPYQNRANVAARYDNFAISKVGQHIDAANTAGKMGPRFDRPAIFSLQRFDRDGMPSYKATQQVE